LKEKAKALRMLLGGKEIIVAPGAIDALSARLIEQAGFPAVYVSGAGIASSRLGVPDIGLTTLNEVADSAKQIIQVTHVPVICDIDTGFGNAINVIRTIREFEMIGAAGVHIEDQITPKRCGHIERKQLISQEEMVKKIEACVYARENDDFVIIARTDAIAVKGFEDAISRAKAYGKAGADVLFVEAPRNVEEMKKITELLGDKPLMINMVVKGGKTPVLPVKELEAIGFKIAHYPNLAWTAAIKAMQLVLKELRDNGYVEDEEKLVSFQEMFEVVGISSFRKLEQQFLT
jgi:2,3-dimethylmalate lyase